MSTAGAGGIVLIGVGVLLLNLAYSGRGKQVWDALRGSGAPSGAETPLASDGGASPTVVSRVQNPDGTVTITWSDGKTTTTPTTPQGGKGTVNPNPYNPVRIG